MLEGLRTAAAGMIAQQQQLDAISNDLANANTNGYKRLRVGFSDLLYEQGGRPTAAGADLGTGARAIERGRDFEQGDLRQTDRPLDIALEGQGFFKIKLPDGRQALSRDGDLHIDGKRRLTNQAGALVQPAITIPQGVEESQIFFDPDGTVRAAGKVVGKLSLVNVRSPQNLAPAGENAFLTTAASGNATAASAATVVKQGALEGSNTDMAESMVKMIDAQRTYQLASKAVQTADQMMEIPNRVKR